MRIRTIVVSCLPAVAVLAIAVPAEASSASQDTVILTVFGDSEHVVNDQFSMDELAPLGVEPSEYQPVSNGAVRDTTTSEFNPELVLDSPSSTIPLSSEEVTAAESQVAGATTALSGSYSTVSTWSDRAG